MSVEQIVRVIDESVVVFGGSGEMVLEGSRNRKKFLVS